MVEGNGKSTKPTDEWSRLDQKFDNLTALVLQLIESQDEVIEKLNNLNLVDSNGGYSTFIVDES